MLAPLNASQIERKVSTSVESKVQSLDSKPMKRFEYPLLDEERLSLISMDLIHY